MQPPIERAYRVADLLTITQLLGNGAPPQCCDGSHIMTNPSLILASPANGLMDKVIAEWDRQLASQKLPRSALDAVRTYEAQLQPDRTYGVYILCAPDGKGGGNPPYDAFVHINHAFPRSPKPVLRMTWNRLAPRYEWSSDPETDHARVFTGLLAGGLQLGKGPLKSAEMKVYLYNSADRAFGRRFVNALTGLSLPFSVSLQGNWLHLGWE